MSNLRHAMVAFGILATGSAHAGKVVGSRMTRAYVEDRGGFDVSIFPLRFHLSRTTIGVVDALGNSGRRYRVSVGAGLSTGFGFWHHLPGAQTKGIPVREPILDLQFVSLGKTWEAPRAWSGGGTYRPPPRGKKWITSVGFLKWLRHPVEPPLRSSDVNVEFGGVSLPLSRDENVKGPGFQLNIGSLIGSE